MASKGRLCNCSASQRIFESFAGSEKPEITDMLKIISNVEWFQLGLELKLPRGKLNDIYTENRRAANQRIAMLDLWLSYCPDASWNIFADALDRMGEHTSATTVRQNHCGGLAPVPSSSSALGEYLHV